MKKKLLAAAVVSAFAAPVAFAQTAPANVTIYGTLQMELLNQSGDAESGNPDWSSRGKVGSPGVFFIGFRGTESLGGGLSAIWQIEQGAGGDGTGTTNTWGSRNTYLGLSGGFGQVFVGIFDAPLKRVLGINNALGGGSGLTGAQGMNSILNNGDTSGADPFNPSGTQGSNSAFSRRVGNSLNYISPTISGFQFAAQYAANENKGTSGATSPGLANVDPYQWGLSATWTSGPFKVGVGYEFHNDYRVTPLTPATAAGSRDDASWLVSASWGSGPFLITGAYSRLEYGTGTGDLTRDNWLLNGQYSMGQHRFRAGYQLAQDTKGAINNGNIGNINNVTVANIGTAAAPIASGSDTGAQMFHLNYGYALSKRTEVYGFWSLIDNDSRGRVNHSGAHASAPTAATNVGGFSTGMDITTFGAGIRHQF